MPRVTIANSAGTPLTNDTATALPVTTASATSSITVVPTTTTSGHYLESAATTNTTVIKSSAALLVSMILTNTSATTKYVKIYNKTTTPVLTTDIPIAVFPIPATSVLSHNFGFGLRLTAGLSYAITSLMPNTDTTAVAAGDVKVAITYT